MTANMKYVFILSLFTHINGLSIDGVPQNLTQPWLPAVVDVPLAAGFSHQLNITAIPATAQLLLLQAHVQRSNVTLQQAAADGSGPEAVVGAHVGLVTRLEKGQTAATVTVTNSGGEDGIVLVAVTLLLEYTPVPGGCSQIEEVPDAPFFRVETAHDVYSFFTVPRAQLGINRSVGFTCNAARGVLEYNAYVMYPTYELRTDYSAFKEAIVGMLQPVDMQKNAYLVSGRDLMLPLRYTFALYRGYTVVYGVAVTGLVPGRAAAAAAYVPVVLHSCPVFGGNDPGCPPEVSMHFYLTVALLFVCGTLLLTAAAAELALNVLLTTAVLVAALAVLTFRLVVWDESNVSLAVGVILGLLAGLLYARQLTAGGWNRGSMTIGMALLFGVSVGAVFFIVPGLQLDDLTSDAIFWPALVFLTLALAFVVMIPGLEWCIVVTRCVLGSAWVMASLAMLTSSVTVYVFANLFSRAIYPEFRFAILQMRFLAQDYICVSVFGLLLLVSLCVSCAAVVRQSSEAETARAAPPRRPGLRARHWAERHQLLPDDHHLLIGGYGATAPQAPPSA